MKQCNSRSALLNVMFGSVTAILLIAIALVLSQKWRLRMNEDVAEIEKGVATLRMLEANGESAVGDEQRKEAIAALAAWGENFARSNRSIDEGTRSILLGSQSALFAATGCLLVTFFVTLRSWRAMRRQSQPAHSTSKPAESCS